MSAGLAAEVRRRLGPPPASSAWPLVSIVVLNRDGVEHLRRLVAGLRERTDYPQLELILVNNASSDGSLDFMRRVEAPFPISIVANAHNESFSDGCNQGAMLATGELLLFLNNDAEPFESGWLRELVVCLHSGAGAVGPTLVKPANDAELPGRYLVNQRGLRSREEEGMLVPVYRDRGDDPLGDRLGEDTEVLVVVAACLLIGREAFDEIGGFTHGYRYGPEDVNLALKLRERGMSVRCSGRSLLIHSPNSTLDTVGAERRGEWVRGNRRLFGERWGARVRREYELDRLRGGGLWAEPGLPAVSAWGATEAEVEALGFCLKSAVPEWEERPGPSLEELSAALRRHRRRAIVLCAEEVESVAAFDYDVAVHFGGSGRYALKPAQLNLLWLAGGVPPPHPLESSAYDLILSADDAAPGGSAEHVAACLIEAGDELALRRAFKTRVAPRAGDPALVSPR